MELILAEAMARAIWTKYLHTASVKHPQVHSAYEGAAILKEKYDILWEEVRLDAERTRAAAVQVAATAVGFVVDTCPPTETTDKARWTRNRKALEPRLEKEIAAFERRQRSVGKTDREGPSLGRARRKPRDGHPAKLPWAAVPRPRKCGCRSL